MQFGASTFIWVSPFSIDAFDLVHKVKEMGYDILEVAVEDKNLIDWDKLKSYLYLLIILLKKEGVYMEKEIQNMAIRHDHRIKDILRYYPDNDYF